MDFKKNIYIKPSAGLWERHSELVQMNPHQAFKTTICACLVSRRYHCLFVLFLQNQALFE